MHFIPFAVLFTLYAPYVFQSGAEKLKDGYSIYTDVPEWKRNILFYLNWIFTAQLIIYPLLVLRRVRKKFNVFDGKNDSLITQMKWIKLFSYLFLIYGIMMLLYVTLMSLNIGGISKDYPISLVMCVTIYCISYFSIINPELLKGKSFLDKIPTLKYAKSRLSDEYLARISAKFERAIEKDALHLNGDLKIDQVAEMMAIPKHHISQALNLKMEKTFNEYVNERRVQHAQKLLNEMSEDENIKTIMYMSGFNNRASFNNNFKKWLGMTATEYVKVKNTPFKS